MSLKKSVMLSDETLAFISARTRDTGDTDIKWSQAVNGAFSELSRLYGQLLPDLSQQEWTLILNAYNGHFFDQNSHRISIASCIMDDLGEVSFEDLDDETAAAVRRIHGLSQPEQAAVLDMVKKFWGGSATKTGSLLEIIESLK